MSGYADGIAVVASLRESIAASSTVHRYDEPIFSAFLNRRSMIGPSTSLVLEIILHRITLISKSPENLLPRFRSLFLLRMCLESLGFRTDSTGYFDLSSLPYRVKTPHPIAEYHFLSKVSNLSTG